MISRSIVNTDKIMLKPKEALTLSTVEYYLVKKHITFEDHFDLDKDSFLDSYSSSESLASRPNAKVLASHVDAEMRASQSVEEEIDANEEVEEKEEAEFEKMVVAKYYSWSSVISFKYFLWQVQK